MPRIWERKPRSSRSPPKGHSAVLVSLFPPAVILLTLSCHSRPSNVTRRRRAYATLPHVQVEPLYFSENDLTADRMLAIMGCDNTEVIGYSTSLDSRSLRDRRCPCTCILHFCSSVTWAWMHSTTEASQRSIVVLVADENQSLSARSTTRTWTRCKKQWLSFVLISLTRSFVQKHRISSRTSVLES